MRFIEILPPHQDASIRRCIKADSIEMLSVEPDERRHGYLVGIYVVASESVMYERYATKEEADDRYYKLKNLVEIITP